MRQPDPAELFDAQHAAQYDERFIKLAPLRETLNLLAVAAFLHLPAQARILCVGAGTGSEMLSLAERFPGWHFTAVEPSGPMLEVCRRRMAEAGISERCVFHHGYVDALTGTEPYDAATAILVSHFILSPEARAAFFRGIAERLRAGGVLVNADLAYDTGAPLYPGLLELWVRLMQSAQVSAEQIGKLQEAYQRDVALVAPAELAALIRASGFEEPMGVFQAGLIHGWVSRRGSA